MFFNSHLTKKAANLIAIMKDCGVKLSLAESCTGGLISSLITEVSGSSSVFDRSFVTYSNEAKIQMLAVDKNLIAQHGAVSEEVAKAMAIGAIINSNANVVAAVTGVAGPLGGSEEKPVGLVYIAVIRYDDEQKDPEKIVKNAKISIRKFNFAGDRVDVRRASVENVLRLLGDLM